ncbi:adenylate/guanylate cyclase domain-containing protein [Sphingosinicella sp.]|uniref:adenylate/guanylate cyclase domain-containing protein n=1 Tax=Sphingosinicella sp. TaxID=1917971 RepID=UPI004038052F
MAAFAPRFADPETERAFLSEERAQRGRAIRALIVIAVATLGSYILINPMHFPRAGVTAYAAAAAVLGAMMIGFFLLTQTRLYQERPAIDLPVFVLLALGMGWLSQVLADLAPFTGFPPHVMVMVQLGILVVFASVGFAGTFRLFLVWATVLLGLAIIWMMTRPGVPDISRVYTLTNFSTFWIFALYFNWDVERRAREVFTANLALAAEKAKTEELLYNVLPQEVAARLKAGDAVADAFTDVAVVFVDLVGFSRLAKRLSPGHLVQLLNAYFSAGDRCCDRHGLEKVKTIGDAYLAVAGGMASRDADARAAVGFARDLIGELKALSEERGIALQARVGLHVGPAVGGVIGTNRLAYDYWGDTMNIAARLQSVAPPNGIAVSEAAWLQVGSMIACEPQILVLKGVGETEVYLATLESSA